MIIDNHQKEAIQAILIACICWSGFAVADATAKWLGAYFSVHNILFISSSFTTLSLGIFIFIKKGIKGFYSPNLILHLLRGVMVFSLSWLFFSALVMGIPMSDFYGIVFTTPFFVMLFAKIIMNEEIGKHRIIATIAGFIGVLIIAESSFKTLDLAYLYTLIGASLVGASAIVVRKIGKKDFYPIYVFYPSMVVMLANSYPALKDLHAFYIPDTEKLIFLVIHVGFLLFSQLTFVTFINKSPLASIVAPFQYIQMIGGTLFGWFLFNEIPSFNATIGSAIIIMAGLYAIYREKRFSHKSS